MQVIRRVVGKDEAEHDARHAARGEAAGRAREAILEAEESARVRKLEYDVLVKKTRAN